ncbi:MAG: hypothetical protein Q7K42_03125, partial [Candidatus Diapherotrites archaeon]|nr:hypothetical protein [Candidatus Diapherotrites archaeon]
LDVHLVLNSGKVERLCIDTLNSKVNSVERNQCVSPTLNVTVSEATLKELALSQDPVNGVLSAYTSGKIKTEPVGFGPTLKVTFVNIAAFFLNLFNSLFG